MVFESSCVDISVTGSRSMLGHAHESDDANDEQLHVQQVGDTGSPTPEGLEPSHDEGDVGDQWVHAEPRRPPSAYFLFADHRQEFMSSPRDLRQLNAEWADMCSEGRLGWTAEANNLKVRYDEQMSQWRRLGRYFKSDSNEVAAVKNWSEVEIQDWCRATMRMASEAFEQELVRMENSTSTHMKTGGAKKQCLEARSEVINQRWQYAKSHIPASLHGAIQQILQEDFM